LFLYDQQHAFKIQIFINRTAVAKDFKIRDGDIRYYSNAGLVGLSKFASLVNTLISPVTNSVYNASRSATLVAPAALPLMP